MPTTNIQSSRVGRGVSGGPWFKTLFRGIANETEASNGYRPQRLHSRRDSQNSTASVASPALSSDDGSELLEDFPSKPRQLSYSNDVSSISEMTAELTCEDSFRNSEESEEDSEVDRDFKPAAAAKIKPVMKKTPSNQGPSNLGNNSTNSTSQKQSTNSNNKPARNNRKLKKSVRIVLENSTVHTFEKYISRENASRDIARLFYSKLERHEFTKESLGMAKIFRHSLQDHHEKAAAAALLSAASNEATEEECEGQELSKIFPAMFPSSSVFQEALLNHGHIHVENEEIVGIDHLVYQKRIIVALNGLRMKHSKTVLEHYRQARHAREFRDYNNHRHRHHNHLRSNGSSFYSLNDAVERSARVEQEALAQISRRFSSVSSQIALRKEPRLLLTFVKKRNNE